MLDRVLKRICVAIPCLAVVSGCDAISQMVNAGTTVGFQVCMDSGKDQALERKTVKTFCIFKHQQPIEVEVWGSGRYEKDSNGKYHYVGRIRNKSKEFVLTGADVVLSRKDLTPGGNLPFVTLEGVWIEPDGTESYVISSDKIDPQPKEDKLGDGEWNAMAQKGIKIKM